MAEGYQVRVQYPGVEFLGGSQTRAVMNVGYVSKPSNVYFEARIPKPLYTAKQVRDYGLGFSGSIEEVAGLEGVAGQQWVQAQQPDGTLLDQMIVYVDSTSGDSQDSFVLSFGNLSAHFAKPKVDALRAKLDDIEGS